MKKSQSFEPPKKSKGEIPVQDHNQNIGQELASENPEIQEQAAAEVQQDSHE